MFKVIYFRYGNKEITNFKTRAEANYHFNYISEFGLGFPDCILDENGIIIRDGTSNVIGNRSKNRKGKEYILT